MGVLYFLLSFFILMILVGMLVILLSKELVNIVVGYIATILSVSALMAIAFADLNSIIQIVVYTGGIGILLLFGMMLSKSNGNRPDLASPIFNRVNGYGLGILVLLFLGYGIGNYNFRFIPGLNDFQGNLTEDSNSTFSTIGTQLFTYYALPLEVLGLSLLLVLVFLAEITKGNAVESDQSDKEVAEKG
jgi:NADH:ubiquinone oxidoreductase subunit 6 (subunit J)